MCHIKQPTKLLAATNKKCIAEPVCRFGWIIGYENSPKTKKAAHSEDTKKTSENSEDD